MTDDAELLRRYASQHDQEAFAEIVRRHLGLVYHAALRQCGGDTHRAQDVAQTVFSDLARKAAQLAQRPVLAGWLFTSTRYAASQAVRTEVRRQAREREAQMMNEISSNAEATSVVEWERLRPVIDDAMHALSERDREALLLRCFEGRTFGDIGMKLRLSEDAARMRVERALEKMRVALSRRGVTSTTAALTLAMTAQAVAAVPAGLVASVSSVALTAASSGAGTAALVFMSTVKLKVGLLVGLAAAGTGGVIVQSQAHATLREELTSLQQRNAEAARLRTENGRLEKIAAELLVYRTDDAELTQLNREALVLKERLQKIAESRERTRPAPLTSAGGMSFPAPLNASAGDRPPLVRSSASAVYPPELMSERVNGEVLVEFIVDSNGNVANAHAVKSSRREFEAAAIEAVRKWKFDPGVKGKRAVNTHQQTAITFQPPESDGVLSKPGWF